MDQATTKQHLAAWLGGAVIALALGGGGLMLDGPSDMQAEEDTALAVSDLAKMEGAK